MCVCTLSSDPDHLHFSLKCLPNEEEIKNVRLPIARSNTFSGARASFYWASRSSGLLPGSCASPLQGGNLTSAVGYWTRKKRRVAARRLNWNLLERVAGERAKSVVEAPKSPKQLILNFSESFFYPTFPYALSSANQKHWRQNSASFLLVIRTAWSMNLELPALSSASIPNLFMHTNFNQNHIPIFQVN